MNIAKKLVSETSITFAWADETSETVNLDQFDEATIRRAALHGLAQKLGDSYSGAKSVKEAKVAYHGVLGALLQGDWNRKGGQSGGIWAEALARAAGVTLEEAVEKWLKMTEEERKGVQAHPEVKAAKAAIDLERAQAKAKQAAKASDGEADDLTSLFN